MRSDCASCALGSDIDSVHVNRGSPISEVSETLGDVAATGGDKLDQAWTLGFGCPADRSRKTHRTGNMAMVVEDGSANPKRTLIQILNRDVIPSTTNLVKEIVKLIGFGNRAVGEAAKRCCLQNTRTLGIGKKGEDDLARSAGIPRHAAPRLREYAQSHGTMPHIDADGAEAVRYEETDRLARGIRKTLNERLGNMRQTQRLLHDHSKGEKSNAEPVSLRLRVALQVIPLFKR